MDFKKEIKASEMLYAIKPVQVSDISKQIGLSEACAEKIKIGMDMYLDDDATPEEIAYKIGLPAEAMQKIVHRFFSKCLDAYRHYQNQAIGSISGSAEAVGINRFYFEDWFWKNAVDSNDDDGKKCLAQLAKEISCL
jgi:hypothetical protein